MTVYGRSCPAEPSRAYTSCRSVAPRSARYASRSSSVAGRYGSRVPSASSTVPGSVLGSGAAAVRSASVSPGSAQNSGAYAAVRSPPATSMNAPVWDQVRVSTGGTCEAGSRLDAADRSTGDSAESSSVSHCSVRPKPRNSRSMPSK